MVSDEACGDEPSFVRRVRERLDERSDVMSYEVVEITHASVDVRVTERGTEEEIRTVLYRVEAEPTPENDIHLHWTFLGATAGDESASGTNRGED